MRETDIKRDGGWGLEPVLLPAATVHLGLLVLSVVQETGWHQGAQCSKCSGRRSLYQSLRTLCQVTVSHNNFILCVMKVHHRV